MSSATWRTVHNTKDGSYPLGGRRFEVQWQHVSGRVVRPAVNTCSQRGAHDGRIHRPFQLMFLAEWSVSVDRPAASTRMRRTCLNFLKIPVVTGINLERCLMMTVPSFGGQHFRAKFLPALPENGWPLL